MNIVYITDGILEFEAEEYEKQEKAFVEENCCPGKGMYKDFYFAGFLAKENGKIPLFVGIISSSIMLSGMIILGSIFEETGVAITYVMSFSILCLFYSICSRKSRQT